jgi:hypothetical protein
MTVTMMQISSEQLGVRGTAEGSAAEHCTARAMDHVEVHQHGAMASTLHPRAYCRQSRVRAAQR